MEISRRHSLGLIGAAAAATPAIAMARFPAIVGAGQRKLLFIIQRGAADGLALVPPVGDPGFAAHRAALTAASAPGAMVGGMFALHGQFANLAAMFAAREAAAVHAAATVYRDRSHFDGQNLLETGGRSPYARRDGWLNRLLTLVGPATTRALAVAPAVPMALRGAAAAGNVAPANGPGLDQDLLNRLSGLYAADPQLDPLWQQALSTRELTGDIGANNGRGGAALGDTAARLLRGDAATPGAGVVMLETGGWDTHSAQARRLDAQVRGLDALLGAVKAGLGPVWGDTLVLVATEFGRTVAVNGTGGTDHGTASALIMCGGAVAASPALGGGAVRADWPGLASEQLFQGRDLRPTASLEAEISRAIASHYRLDAARVRAALYPDLV